jgi:hypothetical protein
MTADVLHHSTPARPRIEALMVRRQGFEPRTR